MNHCIAFFVKNIIPTIIKEMPKYWEINICSLKPKIENNNTPIAVNDTRTGYPINNGIIFNAFVYNNRLIPNNIIAIINLIEKYTPSSLLYCFTFAYFINTLAIVLQKITNKRYIQKFILTPKYHFNDY